MDEALLIVGGGNPVSADYATHCLDRGCRHVTVIADFRTVRKVGNGAELHLANAFSGPDFLVGRRVTKVVVFLDKAVTHRNRTVLETVSAVAKRGE
jgi:hypothetical protein